MNRRAASFGCAAVLAAFAAGATSLPAPMGLTAEYRKNPDGIDTPRPRLSWRLPDGMARQTVYEIEIDGKPQGRVESGESQNVAWPGGALATSQRVTWRVRVWDEANRASDWSAPATFTMGVMRLEDWRAKWIGPAAVTRPDEDFGGAQWITAPADKNGVATLAFSFVFDGARPGEYVEMVHAGVSQHEIDVNGRRFNKWSGHVHDWRYLRFRDLTPYLVKGTNTVVVRLFADKPRTASDPIDPIRLHAPKDARAFLAKIVFPGGRTLVTGAKGWTSPNGAVAALGGPRAPAWGKDMVLRAENASPAFAKAFTVKKPVASAVLHVTGVGFYEAALNGKKIGKKVLDPAPTAFDRRVLYSTYRLDGDLRQGANELRLLVGHGWYDMRAVATWNFETAPWRDFPRAIAQLEIVYTDGTRETVATDGTWWQVKSPVGHDDIFEGEVLGARDLRGPDLDREAVFAAEVPGPAGRLVAEAQPGAEVVREIPAKRIVPFDGGYVLDFGENVAGWVRLTVRGQRKGDVVSVRYDERVNADGTPAAPSARDGLSGARAAAGEARRIDEHFHYTASHRVCAADAAFQTDRLVCSGADAETCEPRFVYHGFRYAAVKGLRRPPKSEDAVACVVRTAFPVIGSFDCSDATLNALMRMAERAYCANFADGVPTDCPHREKNGWTADAGIASELAQYLFENTAGYEKWLRDILDAQLPDGNLPGIVPTSGWGYHWGNGPDWDGALPVTAWNLWAYRGDRRILDEIYPALVRYLAYTAAKADADGLVKHGLGDWVPVNRAHAPSVAFTSSCYYHQAQRIAAEIAALRWLAADAAKWNAGAAKTRAGLNARFYKGGGVYDNGGQTAQAFALAHGLAPEAERPSVEARLVAAVEKADGHLDVGLHGTKQVFRALSRMGRTDLAFRLLTNPTAPSMAEWIRKGGTTLWEDWTGGSSLNHIMFGDFAGWAYQYLAGIRLAEAPRSTSAVTVPTAPAFRELVVEPVFLKELDHLSASTVTPYGKASVAWRRTGASVAVEIGIPPGASAEIRLPGRAPQSVGAGTWRFGLRGWPTALNAEGFEVGRHGE